MSTNLFFIKRGHFRPLFLFFVFSTQLTVNIQYKFLRWQDSNCGLLELEATTLPTEPPTTAWYLNIASRKAESFFPKKWSRYMYLPTYLWHVLFRNQHLFITTALGGNKRAELFIPLSSRNPRSDSSQLFFQQSLGRITAKSLSAPPVLYLPLPLFTYPYLLPFPPSLSLTPLSIYVTFSSLSLFTSLIPTPFISRFTYHYPSLCLLLSISLSPCLLSPLTILLSISIVLCLTEVSLSLRSWSLSLRVSGLYLLET